MGNWSTRVVFGAAMALLCAGVSAQKQLEPVGDYVPGQILVRFSQSPSGPVRDDVLRGTAGARVHKFESLGIDLIDLPPGMPMRAALQSYRAKRGVDLVEPNYVRHAIQAVAPPPTDPSWLDGSLWGLLKIRVQPVWTNFTPGDGSVIVASLDTGINYTHPDLAPNVWRNPLEIPGNGTDDDNDGYVDDVYGINTVAHTSDPKDDSGHGTHTAGTIAAVGNNALGVVGVSWNTKVLACKFLDKTGTGSDAGAIECLNYVVMLKNRGENIRVTSNSWGASRGSDPPSSVLQAAIDTTGDAGIINIFGAGNASDGRTPRLDDAAKNDKHGRGGGAGKEGKKEKGDRNEGDDDNSGASTLGAASGGTDDDVWAFDPASLPSPSIVSVAASDQNDGRSLFSNYGLKSVDLAAPGENILSTWLGSGYQAMSGTSVATPHVAGVAALLAQMNPNLSVAEIKAILLGTVDQLPAWNGLVVSGGRLSANRAAHAVSPASNARPTVTIVSPLEGATAKVPGTVSVEAIANDSDGTIRHVVFYLNGQYAGKVTASPYKITLTDLPLGDYSLSAVAVDDLYGTGTSPDVHFSVGTNKAPVVSLARSATGGTLKSPADITLDASASDDDGTVTQVAFFSNGTLVGIDTTSPYSVAWNGVTTGTYHVTAVATDNDGATSTSAEMLVTVAANQRPTASLTGPANNASVKASASVTVSANASDNDGSVTEVAFFANGSLIGTSSSSPYSVTWKGMAAGSYNLTAVATDDNGATGTSSAVHVTVVANKPPAVMLSLPAAGPFKAPADVTINATASDADGTVAQVAFYQNGTLIATDTTSPYSVAWNGVTAGTYHLTAIATDDDGATTTSAEVLVTVVNNKPPTVSLSVATGPFKAPASITIDAIASDDDGSVTQVAFYQNGALIATDTTSPYSVPWNGVAAGTYHLTAIATDDDGATTTSAEVLVTVVANKPPSVSLSLPAAGPFKAPANITIDASASDADGTVTGVAFYQNGVLIATDSTSPYSVAWNGAAAGTYHLTAVATDDDGATTTSADVLVTVVANKPPSVSLSLPAAGPFKSPANITIDAAASDDDGHVTQVAFYQNGALIATDATSPYSVAWNGVAAGTYHLTAVATDDDGATTTSAEVLVTVVNNKPPTVSLSLSTTGPIKAPANVTIDASASDSDGNVTQVAFYQNGVLITTDAASPYSVPWTGVGPGVYHMTAVATDDDGATTTSADVVLTVVANQPPSVSITAPLDNAVLTAPVNITINASAGDSDGSVTQVAFYVDGALLGTDATAPYSFTWNGVAVGSYTLTAIAIDDNGATMSSAAVHVTVNPPPRINQALAVNGGFASASSTFIPNASYPAAAAINGDRKGLNWGSGGGWCDGTSGVWPDWLEVDFNGLKTIDEINVFTLQDSMNSPVEPTKTMTFTFFGLKTFQVQYWDGSTWVTVPGGAIANNNLVWRQVLLATPVTTTKIRVLVTASLGNFSRIVELEAWGVSANAPAPAPVPEETQR